MAILRTLLSILIWPGNRFCEIVGQDPYEDNGMLRGFVNNIAWGFVAVVILWFSL